MSCDALFQLGMGSVRLDATQTEDTFAACALNAWAEGFCFLERKNRAFAAPAPAGSGLHRGFVSAWPVASPFKA